jgi:DNA replication initiation complex subunit (GINS family)
MEKEVVITYETLFEILRREKAREEIQKLPDNFNEEVRKYLAEKKQTMISGANDQFSEIEQEKTQRQILNIKKILNELYERREKKIVSMALNKSRIPKSVIDTANLTDTEKYLYEKLFSTFNEARSVSLRSIILENPLNHEEHKAEAKQAEMPPEQNEETAPKPETPASKIADGMKKVRFVCDTSQFVGPNLEIYGPFKSDETAVLPASVCTVLVSKNKAELDEN